MEKIDNIDVFQPDLENVGFNEFEGCKPVDEEEEVEQDGVHE